MSDRVIRITVPIDPQRTALNQRLHWRERYRRNARAKDAARLAWLSAGGPQVNGPVRVSVIVRRARVMDVDNIWSGLKPALDGIFRAGVTPDDSSRWVSLGDVTQETGREWRGKEETVFIVEELAAAARKESACDE